MIQDHTIDQALVELARTMKALKALRAARKASGLGCSNAPHGQWRYLEGATQHAAALRASMDLTRKLADLRQGR